MLSIVVLSNRDYNFFRLEENIKKTSSGVLEIIRVKDVSRGLASGYNKGADLAVYNNLCFVHDDVLFHTKGWDELITSHLSKSEVGVIGVMGGRYKSAFGLSWRDGKTDFYRMNVRSGTSAGKHLLMNPLNEKQSFVLCLDGAFLCCRKEIWRRFKFDEQTFTGFHFYDIDFSFRVAQHFRNYVTYEILMEHFSAGDFNKEYVLDGLKFEEKHSKQLPFGLEKITQQEIRQLEGYALTEKLALMKKNGFSRKERLKLVNAYFSRHRNFYQLLRNLYFGFLRT
jgi:hypothetical protein